MISRPCWSYHLMVSRDSPARALRRSADALCAISGVSPMGRSSDMPAASPSVRRLYHDRVQPAWVHSCLIQDEPETEIGFSYKMSLKGRIGMLGIDHQHGRFGSDEPGTDPGVSGSQWRSPIHRPTARRGLRVDRASAGPLPVPRIEPTGKRARSPLCGLYDGPQSGPSH